MSRIPLLVLALALHAPIVRAAAAPPLSTQQLIEDLDDDEFEIRQRASSMLVQRDLPSALAMERARLQKLSLEQRDRIRKALEKIYSAPRTSAELRAVIVLTAEIRALYGSKETRDLTTVLDQLTAQITKEDVAKLRRYEAASAHRYAKLAPLVRRLKALEAKDIHDGKDHDAVTKDLRVLADEIAGIEKNVAKIYDDAFRASALTYTTSIRRRELGLAVSYRAGSYFEVNLGERHVLVVASAAGFRALDPARGNHVLSPQSRIQSFDHAALKGVAENIDADHQARLPKYLIVDSVSGKPGQNYYEVAFHGGGFSSNRPDILALMILKAIWKDSPSKPLPRVQDLPAALREIIRLPVTK